MADNTPTPDDRALVTALQHGDLQALGSLYDRYRLPVYRTALVITRNDAAAEDILQDTFLRLHRYCQWVDVNRPLLPWLYRVTVNLSYSHLRKNARLLNSLEDWIERFVSGADHAPENVTSRHETQRTLDEALARLSTGQRTALVLYYLNGLSVEEVADVMEKPINTVKATLHFARKNLRKHLPQFETLSPEIEMDLRYEATHL